MALIVQLDKGLMLGALEKELASLRRLKNTTKQPQFIPIIEKDIAHFQLAIGSLVDEDEGHAARPPVPGKK